MAFFGFVIFAPINWISLVNLGGLSIKYMHLAILPIVICLLFKTFRLTVVKFIQQNGFIIGSFMLLLVINFVATYLNKTSYPSALSYIAKNFFYCCYFILFGAVMYLRINKSSFHKEITYSNTLSVLTFTLFATLIFHALGRSFLGDMANFFIKGDSVSLRYDLFKILFNADAQGSEELAANLRNTLMGAFIYIHFSSLYANKNISNKFLRICNMVNMAFSAFFVIASVSRSNMLVMVLGYLIYFLGDIFINRNLRRVYEMFGVVIIGITFAIIFWSKIESMFMSSTDMIAGRLGELENDARWELNAEALDSFSKNFLIGKGSGAVLSDGHAVHNFIIGSAFQAGIIGLILSCFFYFGIAGSLLKNLKKLSKYTGAFLVASLLAIPLLRSMESGNAGTLSLVEWFCISIFLAFVMQNKETEAPVQVRKMSGKYYLA